MGLARRRSCAVRVETRPLLALPRRQRQHDACFDAVVGHASPLAGCSMRHADGALQRDAGGAGELDAYLQIDLSDPDFPRTFSRARAPHSGAIGRFSRMP